MGVLFYVVVMDYFCSFVRDSAHISEKFMHLIEVYNNCYVNTQVYENGII